MKNFSIVQRVFERTMVVTKEWLKPFTVSLLLFTFAIGQMWATLTADSISSSAVTSLVNGGKYVIRADTSQNKYLAAKDGTWGSSVAIGSAYIFTVTVDKNGFYADCKDGTLTPATSNFSAYGSATSSNLQLNASGYIVNKSSTSYYLQANGSSSYKFRWYSSSQTKARMYQVGNNIFFTQPGSGSISATSSVSSFNSTLNLMPAVYTGKTATLTATPPSGYEVDAWTVKKKSDNSDVTASVLSGTTLTMPAYDVTVSVTWRSAAACGSAPTVSAGSLKGSINFETVFDPVSPFVEPPEPHARNIVTFAFQSRIPNHLIYTMYISRDFGFEHFCSFLQKPVKIATFYPFSLALF